MAKELGFICYILTPDRGPVPMNEMPPEELAAWGKRMSKRSSEAMSDYYTQHPDEYEKLGALGL